MQRGALVAAFLLASLACGGPATPPRIAPGTAPAPSAVTETCDPCVLLMEHRFADLRTGTWCRLCGPTDVAACAEPFPGKGVACDELDRLRNCIYARLGYDFADAPEWRAVFEKEPWYRADPSFDWDEVDEVQENNARVLREMVRDRQCRR